MEQKLEFVRLADGGGGRLCAALCLRFGIGRTCGYKWSGRYRRQGEAGLRERSRRPLASAAAERPGGGGGSVLGAESGASGLGRTEDRARARPTRPALRVAASTVTGILRRGGVPLGRFGGGLPAPERFEHEAPNDLWQMDFKGHVALTPGRLHPLTVLDDHSRFCAGDGGLRRRTRDDRAGAPDRDVPPLRAAARMLIDNGPPGATAAAGPLTPLTVWLIEHGVAVSHSRPLPSADQGKDERFHRTLKAEALAGPPFARPRRRPGRASTPGGASTTPPAARRPGPAPCRSTATAPRTRS